LTPPTLPQWDTDRALGALDIEPTHFTETDGNCQGYARKRQIAINPVAQLPHKTLFHEGAHLILGHTTEADFTDTERTPRSLREVEAEVCEELYHVDGRGFSRAYMGKYPSLRKALENKRIPDSYYGPTSISDNMFDAMVRFVTIAILVREYPQDIMIYLTKEFSK
jgi:hypothetical protein